MLYNRWLKILSRRKMSELMKGHFVSIAPNQKVQRNRLAKQMDPFFVPLGPIQ
jgi:hypothetical protein